MKRVLVVDDDASAAELTLRYLKPLGYHVVAAYSGLEAVEKLRAEPFDLVISDVRMPNGSGIDVLRELQKLPQKTPAILISADAAGAKLQAKALGADAFLAKPLSREALVSVVESLMPASLAAFNSAPVVAPQMAANSGVETPAGTFLDLN